MHRDFRVEDNVGLMKLLEKSNRVYLFFIFSQKQLEDNLYFNHNSFNYMVSALKELNQKIHINFFKDKSEVQLFQKIHKIEKIQRIYTNFDYTPFSISRSKELASFCSENNIEYKEHLDYLLFQPGNIVKSDNSEYKIFKYFYQKCLFNYQKISKPVTVKFQAQKYESHHLFNISEVRITTIDIPYKRESVIQIIENVNLTSYMQRDYWYKDTNNISASIKYGNSFL